MKKKIYIGKFMVNNIKYGVIIDNNLYYYHKHKSARILPHINIIGPTRKTDILLGEFPEYWFRGKYKDRLSKNESEALVLFLNGNKTRIEQIWNEELKEFFRISTICPVRLNNIEDYKYIVDSDRNVFYLENLNDYKLYGLEKFDSIPNNIKIYLPQYTKNLNCHVWIVNNNIADIIEVQTLKSIRYTKDNLKSPIMFNWIMDKYVFDEFVKLNKQIQDFIIYNKSKIQQIWNNDECYS